MQNLTLQLDISIGKDIISFNFFISENDCSGMISTIHFNDISNGIDFLRFIIKKYTEMFYMLTSFIISIFDHIDSNYIFSKIFNGYVIDPFWNCGTK